MAERKPAFYTKRYLQDKFSSDAYKNDLIATVFEGSGLPYPYELEQTTDGRVIDPKLGEADILTYYDLSTPEGQSGAIIRETLINEPPRTAAIWISPPGGKYDRASIQVGSIELNKETGLKKMRSYGLVVTEFDQVGCLDLGKSITKRFNIDRILNHLDDLRSSVFVFKIPEDIKPVDFFGEIIPIPEKWQKVKSGEIQKEIERAEKNALEAARKTLPLVHGARTHHDHLIAGALAEQIMLQKGWSLQYLTCAPSNTSLLGNYILNTHILVTDEKIFISSELGKFIKKCGVCKRDLNRLMKAHDYCPYCGGEYKGC